MELLPVVGSVLVSHAPVYLVWICAIALAGALWRRHPRASLLTILGVSILLVTSLVGTVISISMPLYLRSSQNMPASQMGVVMGAWSIAMSIVQAGAWVLVLLAIFGARTTAATTSPAAGTSS